MAGRSSPTMSKKKRSCHSSSGTKAGGGQQELFFSAYSAISAVRVPQSKSKSRIGRPVSGVSFAFFTASWNFFSSNSEACFCASIDCRKIESRRLSCSFMARAASSMSLKVFGLTGAVCAIMLRVDASIFRTAPQHGQVTSKLDSRELDLCFTTGDHTAIPISAALVEWAEYETHKASPTPAARSTLLPPVPPESRQNSGQVFPVQNAVHPGSKCSMWQSQTPVPRECCKPHPGSIATEKGTLQGEPRLPGYAAPVQKTRPSHGLASSQRPAMHNAVMPYSGDETVAYRNLIVPCLPI